MVQIVICLTCETLRNDKYKHLLRHGSRRRRPRRRPLEASRTCVVTTTYEYRTSGGISRTLKALPSSRNSAFPVRSLLHWYANTTTTRRRRRPDGVWCCWDNSRGGSSALSSWLTQSSTSGPFSERFSKPFSRSFSGPFFEVFFGPLFGSFSGSFF